MPYTDVAIGPMACQGDMASLLGSQTDTPNGRPLNRENGLGVYGV